MTVDSRGLWWKDKDVHPAAVSRSGRAPSAKGQGGSRCAVVLCSLQVQVQAGLQPTCHLPLAKFATGSVWLVNCGSRA
jgi:hypothetical protein